MFLILLLSFEFTLHALSHVGSVACKASEHSARGRMQIWDVALHLRAEKAFLCEMKVHFRGQVLILPQTDCVMLAKALNILGLGFLFHKVQVLE